MIMNVSFSPDGKTVVSTCDDGTVRLFNVATQREVLTLVQKGRTTDYPLFSEDGSTLAASSHDPDGRPARFWWAPTFPQIDEMIRTGRHNH